MKTCFKCGVAKEIAEFYRHPQMADGHLNKCKVCAKEDVRLVRAGKTVEELRAYERRRNQTPGRRLARAVLSKRQRATRPEKYRARTAVSNALRDGRLRKGPCQECGAAKAEAHHRDYSKPLEVQWLCFAHHREADKKLRVNSGG